MSKTKNTETTNEPRTTPHGLRLIEDEEYYPGRVVETEHGWIAYSDGVRGGSFFRQGCDYLGGFYKHKSSAVARIRKVCGRNAEIEVVRK